MEEDNKEQEAPNTRFEQKPETQADSSLFKQEEKSQEDMSFAEKFNENSANAPVGPITQKIRDNRPTMSYYRLIKMMTALGENVTKGTTNLLVSAARGPIEFGKMVKENIEEGLETSKDAPSLRDVGKRLGEVIKGE